MVKKICLIVFSIIISLLLYELFLRFSPFEYGLASAKYDSDIGLWHKKSFSDYKIKECYKTQFIFDEKGRVKSIFNYDDAKKDVVILGDSYVEAQMVKNENIIHNSLAKVYNNQYNFLNYALYNTSVIQHLMILKRKVNLDNVKYVLGFVNIDGDLAEANIKNKNKFSRPQVFVNFKNLDEYKVNPPREQILYDKVGDFLGNFQVYSYLKKTLFYVKNIIFPKKNEDSLVKKEKNNENKESWLNITGAIYQTNKFAKENGVIYKSIVYSKKEKNKKKITSFLKSHNIGYLVLNDQSKFELKGFSCDKHWNNETHKNIAKYIREVNFIN